MTFKPGSFGSTLFVAAGALALVVGCSSSSSSSGLSAEESAALAVFSGPGAAEGARESLPETDMFDMADNGGAGGAGFSIMGSGECSESGSFNEGTGSANDVFGDSVSTETATFIDYTVTCPSAQAQVDGRIEVGESGGRFFGEFGNPGAGDGPFTATVQADGTPGMSFDMAALVRVCEGCGGSDDGGYSVGGNPEFQAEFYMLADIDMGELGGHFRFGEAPGNPMVFRVWNPGSGNETVAMDGRMGVDMSGSPCGFDWVMDTQSPVVYQGDQPWNGHMIVSDPDDASANYNVVINDGVITVNGELITEERKEQIAQRCDFDEG